MRNTTADRPTDDTDRQLTIAPMRGDDVPLVAAMEQRNYAFPWSERLFRDCVKSGYACLLAQQSGQAVGYAIVQVAADEAHLLNLCIDAACQHRGYGRRFLEWIIASTRAQGARILFLEVRPSNPRAVQLYQRAGFNEIGMRRNYYDAPGGREDGLVMARSLL